MPTLRARSNDVTTVPAYDTLRTIAVTLDSSVRSEDGDGSSDIVLHSPRSSLMSPSRQESTPPHSCTSCSEVETEFAAAVLFVESYQGPHRILTQESSTPKKEFYAFYQQATVGPCLNTSPPTTISKLELAKWEKWKNLGQMTRQEAMKRYTTVLDNLVDDWRRSASIKGTSLYLNNHNSNHAIPDSSYSSSSSTTNQSNKKALSIFERIPKMYEDFSDLKGRIDDEVVKREELESHLLSFTRENRVHFSREMRQVDQMRSQLTSLVKTLEDDVTHHYTELQQVIARHQELSTRIEGSMMLAFELKVRQIFLIAMEWMRHKSFRRVLLLLFVFRLWNLLRDRRLPVFFANFLIRCISAASSLEKKKK